MMKPDIVRDLARRTRLPLPDAQESINRILDFLAEVLEQGERVEIRDFGVFRLSIRPGRMGRNPRTGETVSVPPTRYVRFRAGRLLSKTVQESFLRKQEGVTE